MDNKVMKLALIAPTPPDISAFGVRSLSAFLRQQGVQVTTIFLPGGVEQTRYNRRFVYRYPEPLLEQVKARVSGADLIGVSLMTNYYDRAVQITESLRPLRIPIIWGGIHPTVKPDESLEHADMVCIGEGEEALFEVLEHVRMDRHPAGVGNIWCRENGTIVRNAPRPLGKTLDRYPFADYSGRHDFITDLEKNELVPLSADMLRRLLPHEPTPQGEFLPSYKILTARGCPYQCSFCAIQMLKQLYGEEKFHRTRSIDHVMEELKYIKGKFPFIGIINIFDDIFLARPLEDILDFARRYKEDIGLPFECQVSAGTLTEKKLDVLVGAGLIFVEMGIQAASEASRNLYCRKETDDTVLRAATLLHHYRDRMLPPCYHVILDNPWETTEQTLETFDLLTCLPGPFWMKKASLVCYPGTPLYQRARSEGMLRDEKAEIYRKHLHTPSASYPNLLIHLVEPPRFPRSLLRMLRRPSVVKILDRRGLQSFYGLFLRLIAIGRLFGKGLGALLRGDVKRIKRYLWRTR